MSEQRIVIPSWMQWPPNCCETCVSWEINSEIRWIGRCTSATSLDDGTVTDSRYRCPAFVRKKEIAMKT